MAFTKPVFNLIANVWQCNTPISAAPDWTGLPCQKYIASRLFLDVTPPYYENWWAEWVPPVQIRFARDTFPFTAPWFDWVFSYVECPEDSGQYYKVTWREIQHQGFPNEYGLLICAQCTAEGKAVAPPGYTWPLTTDSDACPIPAPLAAFAKKYVDKPQIRRTM